MGVDAAGFAAGALSEPEAFEAPDVDVAELAGAAVEAESAGFAALSLFDASSDFVAAFAASRSAFFPSLP